MVLLGILFYGIAFVLSMLGKGGGEFYVPILITLGIPYQQAAGTSLFILMVSGLLMMIVYHKKALIDWTTGLGVIATTATGSFIGGFVSPGIDPRWLKLTFSILLFISLWFISHPPKQKELLKIGPILKRKCCGESYEFPVLIVLPVIFVIGFLAGMVGISGGGLIVPLLIILGDMPMRIAFATNSIMILFSSFTGFLGRGLRVGIDWKFTLILAIFVGLGALSGAHFSQKVKIQNLKRIFIWVIGFAALWMMIKVFV